MNSLDTIYQDLVDANYKLFSYWAENLFLTPIWWIMLGLFILPWLLLFFVIRVKQVSNKIIIPILFCILVAVFGDYLGVSYGLWFYKEKLTPLSIDVPWDFTLFPTFVSILLIIKPNTRPIIKGIFFALIVAFVAEPLFNMVDFYVYLKWRYTYSLPLYFIFYLISYKLYNMGLTKDNKSKNCN
jgi:hypothetical protein